MKTIGQIIGMARKEKRYSFENLEEITKIKSSFIEAIENENWKLLPPFPTVLGFVKSISGILDIDEKMAVAVLKRDYPPSKISPNPKPDISSKPVWNPKLTFFIGVGAIVVLVTVYLGIQYFNFISPPKIDLQSPIENQTVVGDSVLVFGSTEIDAKVTANNEPVLVDDDGNFSVSLEVSPETNSVVVKAISRSGKETIIERKIVIGENK